MLREAARLFAAQGIERTSTREIAAAAATTERTLFKHFGSKSGLVQAVLTEVAMAVMQEAAFARILDPRPFTVDEFSAWHRGFLHERLAAAAGASDAYRILFSEIFRDEQFKARYVNEWQAKVLQPLTGHLALLASGGTGRDAGQAVALAAAFFSLNIGYLVARFVLAPEADWSDQKDVSRIVDLYAAMLRGSTP